MPNRHCACGIRKIDPCPNYLLLGIFIIILRIKRIDTNVKVILIRHLYYKNMIPVFGIAGLLL
jgi:hypothetical protein